MGEGENLAPSFWLACANLIKNAKINYVDFAVKNGEAKFATDGDFIKFRVLNLAFKIATLIVCYFLYGA